MYERVRAASASMHNPHTIFRIPETNRSRRPTGGILQRWFGVKVFEGVSVRRVLAEGNVLDTKLRTGLIFDSVGAGRHMATSTRAEGENQGNFLQKVPLVKKFVRKPSHCI